MEQSQFSSEQVSALINQAFITALIIIIGTCIYIWNEWGVLSQNDLSSLGYLIMNFHNKPDFDDFMLIYNKNKQLIKQCGSKVKYFIWGVYLIHPQFFNDDRKKQISQWIPEIERGLNQVKSVPTSSLLDSVWALYFATGYRKYSDIIRDIANNCSDFVVRNGARWSYNDIMGESYIYVQTQNVQTQNVQTQNVQK